MHYYFGIIGLSVGEKGYAALPGRETDFKASLSKSIEYAVALNCPRQATFVKIPEIFLFLELRSCIRWKKKITC